MKFATSIALLSVLAMPAGAFARPAPQSGHGQRPQASARPANGVSAFEPVIAQPSAAEPEPPALQSATAEFDSRARTIEQDSAKLDAMQKEFDKEMAADAAKVEANQPKAAPNQVPLAGDELSNALGISFGTSGSAGVLVSEVRTGTPAEKAGLKAGDVITEWDGKPVHSLADLQGELRGTSAEKSIHVKIVRNGLYQAVSIDKEEPRPAKAAELDNSLPVSQ